MCVMGRGPKRAKVMVVGRMPNSANFQKTLNTQLEDVGIDTSEVYFTQALKCRNFDQNSSNADVKACRGYLEAEIAEIQPEYILPMGNEALLATTGHSGIQKYRGRPITKGSQLIFPTISPSVVTRNPGQWPGYRADLTLFANKVLGKEVDINPPTYFQVKTVKDLKKLKSILLRARLIAYDVETHSEEWRSNGRIVSISGTCEVKSKSGRWGIFGFALPLYHPDSPFRKTWRAAVRLLAPALERVPRVIAHNGKYDDKWMNRFGCKLITTFDTLLAIHLLNENVQKGLKPQAAARLGVAPWGIDTKDLLNKPLQEILDYNFLDTYYDYLIYKQLKRELIENPRLMRLFMLLMMPAHRDLVHTELRGIWIDVERLKERTPIAEKKLQDIEDELNGWLPEDGYFDWPTNPKGKPLEINYNPSNFARWFLFQWLRLPILVRGKEKPNGDPGDPSMAEAVLLELEDKHPAVKLMLARVEWQKAISSFFHAYQELYDDNHRIHTNFKLAGTVTGRLSSGKAEQDKISGTRGKVRGVNLQQVPRNPFIRGLFGSAPGWTFVEADYSQVELRIAAFLSRERYMLELFARGEDLHLITTARITGLPRSKITKEVRKVVGKPVNFGFLYGMGWRKFIATAFNNYGAVFTEEQARAARTTYFDLYPGLLPWHARQRRLVGINGRVQSPIGRVRHLPDIYSPDEGVRAEAERQAINSPVQGFASDLAVLSMVHINERIRQRNIAAHCLGLVHDAINFEVRNDHIGYLLPIIKKTMEDVSIPRRQFGVQITVPIVADIKIGRHWGDTQELHPNFIWDWPGLEGIADPPF